MKLEEKFFQAAKDILGKNLKVWKERKVLVYDQKSPLAKLISEAYLKNFENLENSETIKFEESKKEEIKKKLLSLKEWDTVVLVQSTNFRLDNFRIRLNLHNAGVGCLEHNHLAYCKEKDLDTYAEVISFQTPYFDALSFWLKEKSNKANSMIFEAKDWSILKAEGGFEEMKQNTWNYEWKRRWGTFPVWENFTEIKDFSKLNWELLIYAFPDPDLQMEFCKPFRVKIEESFVTEVAKEAPENFKKIIEKIKEGESGKVILRELGFGLNPKLSKEKTLSDVNAFERIAGFHVSLGMKHNIYRFKFPNKIVQRFHIDIFPDIKRIKIDDAIVFEDEKYLFDF